MRTHFLALVLLFIALAYADSHAVDVPEVGYMSTSSWSETDPGKESFLVNYITWDDNKKTLFTTYTLCDKVTSCIGVSYWLTDGFGCAGMGFVANGTDHNGSFDFQYYINDDPYKKQGQKLSCESGFKSGSYRGVPGVVGTCTFPSYNDLPLKVSFRSEVQSFETLVAINSDKIHAFSDVSGARGTKYVAPEMPAACKDSRFTIRGRVPENFPAFTPFHRH